jgi:putative ABC transport system permease protein
LKGKFSNTNNAINFRKGLVSFQFIVSLILFTGTIITYKQVSFLLNKDMGVSYHSKLVIKAPKEKDSNETHLNKIQVLKDKFLQYPEIDDFSFISDVPGKEIENWFWGYRKGDQINTGNAHFRLDVDNNFTEFYNVKLLAGRGFYENSLPGQNNIILNVKAMVRLGFNTPEEAIKGRVIDGIGTELKVIGVVEDFHYYSVKTDAVPTVITNNNHAKKFIALKLHTAETNLISKFEQDYNEIFPNEPFEYFVLEDYVQNDLGTDKTFVRVFGIFSMLAVFIALVGILGLVIITINQTMKDLGIRKVHGANRNDFFKILIKNIIPQYVVAIVVAVPASNYIFKFWVLNNYSYRIELNWVYFTLPVIVLVILFSGVILFQVSKAYQTSIVEVLKVE